MTTRLTRTVLIVPQTLLRELLEGRTSKDIAHRLHLSPRSVETFRYRLMRKLQVRNVAGLIEFAVRHGMVKTEPAPQN